MVHDGTHLVIPAIESTSCRLRLLTAFYMFTVYIAFINGLVEGKSTGHLYQRGLNVARQHATQHLTVTQLVCSKGNWVIKSSND